MPAEDSGGLRQVTTRLKTGVLAPVNIIIAIDFNRTNERKENNSGAAIVEGELSFDCNSLHATGCTPNPYEQVILILEKTLAPITEGNLITCFGFGDETTQDKKVFPFHDDHLPCHNFQEVLFCYKKIVPNLTFAGRTSYAPVVDAAIDIVENSCGGYHILFIITNGQAIRSVNTRDEELSPQEEQTIKSIVNASLHPLSIVLVGVGDGPWEDMQKFMEKIPAREFSNFQFVNFTGIMSDNAIPSENETNFAAAALLQIPDQYKAAIKLGILGQRVTGRAKKITALHPSVPAVGPSNSSINEYSSSSMADIAELMICNYCGANIKNVAFYCGHMACLTCWEKLSKFIGRCPVCWELLSYSIRCIIDEITPLPPSVSAVGPSNSSINEDSSSSMADIGNSMVCSHCKGAIKDMVFTCGHMICSSCWDKYQNCPSCPEISSCFRLFLNS